MSLEDVRAYAESERERANEAEAKLAAIQAMHRPKTGHSPRYAPDDFEREFEPVSFEEYTICDYDKTQWPCKTQTLLATTEAARV